MSNGHNPKQSISKMNELTYMMLEKITHLTKVVYLLNSKQSESEAMIESIINSYEKELWTMVKDANGAMNILKNKIKKLSQDNPVQDNIKSIKDKYNQNLQSYIASYEQLKRDVKEKEAALKKDTQNKIDQMKNEVINISKETEIKVKEYIAKGEEKKQLLEKQLKELQQSNMELVSNNKANEKQIEELKQELKSQSEKSETEMNKRVIEKDNVIKLKDKKIKELNDEITAIKFQIGNNETSLTNLTNQLNNTKKEVKTLSDIDKENREKLKQSDKTIIQCKLKNEEIIKEQTIQNDKINELKLEIEKHTKRIRDNDHYEKSIKEKEDMIIKLETENKLISSDCSKAKDTIDTLNKTLMTNQSKLNDNDSKYNKSLQDNQILNQRLLSLTKELSDLNKKASSTKDTEINLKAQMDKLKYEYHNQEKTLVANYNNQLSNLDKKLNENKQIYEEQKANEQQKNNATINHLNTSINQLHIKIKELENQIRLKNEECDKKAKEELNKELEVLQSKYKSQIEEESQRIQINASLTLNQANQQMKILKSSYGEEKLSIESKHREEIDRITFQNSLKLNEIQLGLYSQISNLKIENIQLKEKLEDCINLSCDTSHLKRNTLTPTQHLLDIDAIIVNLKNEISSKEKMKEENKNNDSNTESNKLMQNILDSLIFLQEKNNSLSNEVTELKVILKTRPSRDADIQKIHQLRELVAKKEKVTKNEMNEIKERETEKKFHLERNNSNFKRVSINSNNSNNNTKLKTMSYQNHKTQKMINDVKQFKLKAINCNSSIR